MVFYVQSGPLSKLVWDTCYNSSSFWENKAQPCLLVASYSIVKIFPISSKQGESNDMFLFLSPILEASPSIVRPMKPSGIQISLYFTVRWCLWWPLRFTPMVEGTKDWYWGSDVPEGSGGPHQSGPTTGGGATTQTWEQGKFRIKAYCLG